MFADELSQEISTLVKQGNINNANLHRLNALFEILNQRLDGPYFFGEHFGLIDIYFLSHILWIDALEQQIFPNYFLKNFPKISQWLIKMKNRPSVRKTMGENYAHHFLELLSRCPLVSRLG